MATNHFTYVGWSAEGHCKLKAHSVKRSLQVKIRKLISLHCIALHWNPNLNLFKKFNKNKKERISWREMVKINKHTEPSFIFPSPSLFLCNSLLLMWFSTISPKKEPYRPLQKRELKLKHHGLLIHSGLSRSTQLAAGSFSPFIFSLLATR
jgi:hypothetical protein